METAPSSPSEEAAPVPTSTPSRLEGGAEDGDVSRFLSVLYSTTSCLHPQSFFIRLDSACNQRCDFCNILGPGVSFHLESAYVRKILRQIGRLRPGATVNFTGGEPTLRSDLPELIAYAKRAGAGRVVLQTNAVRMARGDLLPRLLEAGLDDALVSFHSHREDVSDALTGAPSTWQKTVRGVARALELGLGITLNTVLTTRNAAELPATVQYALDRFPGLRGMILSPLQPHGDLLNHMELMPRNDQLVQPLREAIPLITQAGVRLYLSYCENPLCWLMDVFDVKPTAALRTTIARRLRAHGCDDCHLSTSMDKDKVKPPPCADCHFAGVCYGVWRTYAERFGFGELRPARAESSGRPLRVPISHAPRVDADLVPVNRMSLGRRAAGPGPSQGPSQEQEQEQE